MKRLTTTAERLTDRTRLSVHGELDLSTRDELINAAVPALASAQVLELDLADVPFCDSSGISGVLAIYRMSADAGKHLVVTNPREQVRRALDVSGVLDRLTAEDPPV